MKRRLFQRNEWRRLGWAGVFIGPNVAGFLIFTLFPLALSFLMAFTNWDMRLHNMFRENPIRFVGLRNFTMLFHEPGFFQYLGNTLFLMMGIPFGVAGSLLGAILLSQDLHGHNTRERAWTLAGAGLIAAAILLTVSGAGRLALTTVLGGLAALILFGGACGGRTVHRTLFYFPHFTAGVATFLLWKKLYNPHTGPINQALRPGLDSLAGLVRGTPSVLWTAAAWAAAVAALALILFGWRTVLALWREGELGWIATVIAGLALGLPAAFAPAWAFSRVAGWSVAAVAFAAGAALAVRRLPGREFICAPDRGIGYALISCAARLAAAFALLGLGRVLHTLPAQAAAGLTPPEWLTSYHWAKPSIMLMGLWAALGSNNMLLYLAGLSNIPPELYEAADIDGAGRRQRFRHVTWPQLAPVTFFIVVMSVIGGLQGGFEMARTMTGGGPAGATTTLSYYVYIEGFMTGRLGYASAIAWTLFALVFAVTIFNWKFGNRYVND